MTDHDRLFKELIATFFIEFLELFLPQVASTIERNSIRFMHQNKRALWKLLQVGENGQNVH
jgi:hypothetical protein